MSDNIHVHARDQNNNENNINDFSTLAKTVNFGVIAYDKTKTFGKIGMELSAFYATTIKKFLQFFAVRKTMISKVETNFPVI